MLNKTQHPVVALAIVLLTSSCNATPQESNLLSRPEESNKTTNSNAEGPEHRDVISVARELGITGTHGTNYSYIEQLNDGTHAVIHETFSSKSKYKTITPIWMEPSGPVIDCSYIQSIEDLSIVSVGSYCRGNTPASSKAIEDAVNDEHTATFTANHSWINDVDTPDCDNRMGMEHAAYRIVRCGETQETTEKTITYIFANDLSLHARMPGFEFAGSSEDGHSLVLWKLHKDSPHEIINWRLPIF